jgi:hypothetical protein
LGIRYAELDEELRRDSSGTLESRPEILRDLGVSLLCTLALVTLFLSVAKASASQNQKFVYKTLSVKNAGYVVTMAEDGTARALEDGWDVVEPVSTCYSDKGFRCVIFSGFRFVLPRSPTLLPNEWRYGKTAFHVAYRPSNEDTGIFLITASASDDDKHNYEYFYSRAHGLIAYSRSHSAESRDSSIFVLGSELGFLAGE